jgi:hypothetical protein
MDVAQLANGLVDVPVPLAPEEVGAGPNLDRPFPAAEDVRDVAGEPDRYPVGPAVNRRLGTDPDPRRARIDAQFFETVFGCLRWR